METHFNLLEAFQGAKAPKMPSFEPLEAPGPVNKGFKVQGVQWCKDMQELYGEKEINWKEEINNKMRMMQEDGDLRRLAQFYE